MGSIIVITIIDTLVTLGVSGGVSAMILGLILLFTVVIDVRWLKNRYKVIKQVYVSPAYYELATCPDTSPASASVYAQNDRLKDAEVIGLGIEGMEDVIFDKDDNMYTGNRHGDIYKFYAPDYKRYEIQAHVGGNPLGHAMDRDGNHLICVGMMGLYMKTPDGTVKKLTDETNRSWTSVVDDSRMRLADDLDVALDGRIFFSEATVRHEMHDWPVDALECRGNGRIIEYDPKTDKTRTVIPHLRFANGVCMSYNKESFFFAESWGCRINRYWFAGPKKGTIEWNIIPDLPGYPDNVNRASDGNYWLALVGMRSPAFDISMTEPGFRKRMVDRISNNEWLFPNMNRGCVIKFNEKGEVLESLWDAPGGNFPMITSPREHRGYLYLGGLSNNRVGRLRLPDADPNWTSNLSYWGKL
jgi:ribose transport system permease protein